MSARTKPSVASTRAVAPHAAALCPTGRHFANNCTCSQFYPTTSPYYGGTASRFASNNNNNYTRSQFYPTTSHAYPSYCGGTSAAFPYQRTDSQYPLSDYGHSGYGVTNAYYNPHIMHNPYAHGNTQTKIPFTDYDVPIGRYANGSADYVIKHAAMGGGAALAAAAYSGASGILFHHDAHAAGQHRDDGSP